MAKISSQKGIDFSNFSEDYLNLPGAGTLDKKSTGKSGKRKGKTKSSIMSTYMSSVSIYRKIAITFVVLTVLLAVIVMYFSLVSVKISIIPNKERTTTEFTATVVDKERGREVPGLSLTGLVEPADISVSQTFQTAGKEVKDVAVSGTVTVYNNRTTEQPLVASTRLLSPDGRLYRLQETVRVPARGSVENVSVHADQADKSMEIGPTKFTIPGLSQSAQQLVYAQSTSAFTYQEVGEAVVSEADINQAKGALKTALNEKVSALSQNGAYSSYDKVVYEVGENAIVYDTDVKVGSRVKEFAMSARVTAAVVAFNTKDIAALAKLKVEETMPADKQLQGFDESNFEFSVERYNTAAGVADVNVTAFAQMILKDGTDIIDPQRLVGLTREQLDDYLSSLREVAGYEVKFTPSWVNKVPSLVDHIKVEVSK